MSHEVKVPAVGESITEVVVAQWLKNEGDYVEADDLICEIESDKASFEIPAEQSGILKRRANEGDTLAVDAVLAEILPDEKAKEAEISGNGAKSSKSPEKQPRAEAETETPVTEEVRSETDAPAKTPKSDGAAPRVSPVAANMLSDAGISASSVQGTGAGGKITKEDARKAIADKATESKPEAAEQPVFGTDERGEKRERISTLRKTIARRLVAAKNETAMLTTFNELDLYAVKELRSKYKEKFSDRYDVRLGFMSFFARAACLALREWPAVNGRIDEDHIVYHDYCDISIAVSTPRGLVVPVIRNAERLSMAEIEEAVVKLAERARDNKLSIEEMTGGTFTLTNGGVFGSLISTPIINAPQSAILGLHKIEDRPVVVNGEIVVRPMMYVALSYDHRIVDGRESVSFLVRIKELIEDPARMLLEI